MTGADLKKEIKFGHGKAMLKPVNGESLTATMKGGKIVLKDEKGGISMVTIPDVM